MRFEIHVKVQLLQDELRLLQLYFSTFRYQKVSLHLHGTHSDVQLRRLRYGLVRNQGYRSLDDFLSDYIREDFTNADLKDMININISTSNSISLVTLRLKLDYTSYFSIYERALSKFCVIHTWRR